MIGTRYYDILQYCVYVRHANEFIELVYFYEKMQLRVQLFLQCIHT